jgi:spore coat polysaccharide biosynthesis protein SpsF (cytidylyltransferase family)
LIDDYDDRDPGRFDMTSERVVVVVQARMGATRLPGKVLKTIDDESSLLDVLFDRLTAVSSADEIVLATSSERVDDPIESLAHGRDLSCFRGPEEDVLARFRGAADEYGASDVVRICADNPLTPADDVDDVVSHHLSRNADYTRSVNHPTPIEVVSSDVLRSLDEQSLSASDREHVTAYIREHTAEYDVETVDFDIGTDARLTVDYPEDLHMYRQLSERIGPLVEKTLSDVLEYLESTPAVRKVNESVTRLPEMFDTRPEITVITRTYNSADVVSRSLDSSTNQTIDTGRYEVLVIDDGSEDDTEFVVQSYKKDYPNLIRFVETEHSGAMTTLNQGVDEALGKYIIILDADDTFEPPILERLYSVLESDYEVAYAYCDYYEQLPDGQTVRVDVSENLFDTIAAGILFRKESLLRCGCYDDDIRFPEYDLLLKLQQIGLEGEYVDEALYTYYRHDESLTADDEWVRQGRQELRDRYGEEFNFREY